jgi:hypothetical protein
MDVLVAVGAESSARASAALAGGGHCAKEDQNNYFWAAKEYKGENVNHHDKGHELVIGA